MALQLKTAEIDPGITVVRISGSMTFRWTDSIPTLIVSLLGRGVRRLILDLKDVDQIDSMGGVSLVRCCFAARDANARVCLAAASGCVTQLLKVAHVDTLIPSFPTMVEAREHFTISPNAGATTA